MIEEQKIASTEPASIVEPVSEPAEAPKPEPPVSQPLTEERVQQLIAEATQKALEQGKTLGKREMQGIKDKEVADVKRQARLAEERARGYESSFGELDEETRTKMELARYKNQDRTYQELAREEETRKTQETFDSQLKESLTAHLESLGIDPNDKGVDWAIDAPDFFTGQNRFNASVAKIVKVKQEVSDKRAKDDFKSMESRLRKDLGLDSVDITVSGGTVEGIPTDIDKFREWVSKLSQKEYEEKYADKINQMRREGKIK